MSGWQEVRSTTKDDWKSITADSGEQSVMIYLATLKLALSAVVLDSGLYRQIVVYPSVVQAQLRPATTP